MILAILAVLTPGVPAATMLVLAAEAVVAIRPVACKCHPPLRAAFY
jgi:hypothetical protein